MSVGVCWCCSCASCNRQTTHFFLICLVPKDRQIGCVSDY